jgi:hypothetical protein
MKSPFKNWLRIFVYLFIPLLFFNSLLKAQDLTELARKYEKIHRFSTLFTAQDVRDHLSNENGIQNAIDWCRKTAVTKVYIESFRDGYQADTKTLISARDRFRKEGFIVCGCITTTGIGKPSTGWSAIACLTDSKTQEKVKQIFEHAASIFDEIMIDDFWFTDCTCADCDVARRAGTVKIGNKEFKVHGNTWEDYRRELMLNLSKEYILSAGKKVNPNAKFIIKYPQWYDRFHERGYDVLSETEAFDKIWVGTETRDYNDKRWGGTVQYEGYFIMRWLGGIGGEKCGGGWYDWLGTTRNTYIEQARMTILAGARESFLFCYGGLQKSTGPDNIAALRSNLPELFKIAEEVAKRKVIGIAAWKPANSHPEEEAYVFDFVGMMGLPLVPCHEFPSDFRAGFFSVHALKDKDFISKFGKFLEAGKIAIVTDGLAKRIENQVDLNRSNVVLLKVNRNPKSLLQLTRDELDSIRKTALKPFNITFSAPNKVGLFLFADGSYVIENFNDEPAEVDYNGVKLTIQPRAWKYEWK